MMAPIRVLHGTAGNLLGGVEAVLLTLARHRAAAPGMEPEFAACFDGRLADGLRTLGVPVHVLPPARFSRPWTVWGARRGLLGLLRSRRFDAVVCHGCWPLALFGPVARRAARPLVFWMHDRAGGRHWVERLASRTAPDLALANSRGTAGTLPRLFARVPHEVLYGPVALPARPDDATRAEVRRALDTPSDATVILQASRLERLKGHAALLDALGRLRSRPGWVAWIAGGAQRPHERAYLDELRARVADAGIEGRVRFLGHRDDVPRLMAAADLFCQPNAAPEGLGLVFVEALHAGLPVVTTRMGGAVEVVDESCGLLVQPGDFDELVGALADLIDDPERRRRLGEAGPARARALCDPESRLADLEALIRRTCAGLAS